MNNQECESGKCFYCNTTDNVRLIGSTRKGKQVWTCVKCEHDFMDNVLDPIHDKISLKLRKFVVSD